jgi:hypothetical protein
MNDWELCNLGWEDPINYGLIYEPFLIMHKTKWRGFQYCHPMIGDLEDEFRNGMTEVYIKHRPQWGPIWVQIHERVTHNIRDLTKWTEEILELCPNYRWQIVE